MDDRDLIEPGTQWLARRQSLHYLDDMTRDEALARLRPHAPELRASGVNALFLFGSASRNEAGLDSDVDLLCDLRDSANLGLLDFVRLKDKMSDVLACPVDLIERRTVRPRIWQRIEPELVRVF